MSRTYEYRSGLASQISAFIAEKRACGCKYEKEAKTFQTLDRFLVEQGINTPVLPELVVEKWIEKRPNEKRKNQKWRLNFTKRFAKYLQLNGYAAYYPELTISSRDDADFSPCIFTANSAALLAAGLWPHSYYTGKKKEKKSPILTPKMGGPRSPFRGSLCL